MEAVTQVISIEIYWLSVEEGEHFMSVIVWFSVFGLRIRDTMVNITLVSVTAQYPMTYHPSHAPIQVTVVTDQSELLSNCATVLLILQLMDSRMHRRCIEASGTKCTA